MKFILTTAHIFFLCLFFAVNIYGQKTTKKIIQTFSPEKTIQFVKIESEKDSSYTLNRWDGHIIWIKCTIEAEGKNIGPISSYKARNVKQRDAIILQLNKGEELRFRKGKRTEVKVKYEIFIPKNLNVITD